MVRAQAAHIALVAHGIWAVEHVPLQRPRRWHSHCIMNSEQQCLSGHGLLKFRASSCQFLMERGLIRLVCPYEVLVRYRFFKKNSHCVWLVTHWWVHYTSMDSSKAMGTQMALVTPSGSQIKTKRLEGGK